MSHIDQIDLKVKSLDALKATCHRLGLEWREGQTTYKWYGHHVGDYPMPQGFTHADLGKCTHAIRVPGASYEVGVVLRQGVSGEEITLMWDFWQSGGLERKLGKGAGLFRQAYAVEQAKIEARRKGYSVYEKLAEDGKTIQLTMRKV